jgi:hypothetical protein
MRGRSGRRQVGVDGGDLVVEAARPLPTELVERLRVHKAEVLAVLRGKRSPEPFSALAGNLSEETHGAIHEAVEEPATIHEFEGGLSRTEVPQLARESMRVYEYRLADTPSTWHVLIALGCDLPEARRVCEMNVCWRFGRLSADGRPLPDLAGRLIVAPVVEVKSPLLRHES